MKQNIFFTRESEREENGKPEGTIAVVGQKLQKNMYEKYLKSKNSETFIFQDLKHM
jgi:hypothetical protein